MAEQLDDLFAYRLTHDQVSMSRALTDDGLFHDRQLESTKLRLLGIVGSALLFALTAAFFIMVRGTEDLSIEAIIAYIFAIRFATTSVQQILKALGRPGRARDHRLWARRGKGARVLWHDGFRAAWLCHRGTGFRALQTAFQAVLMRVIAPPSRSSTCSARPPTTTGACRRAWS